VDFPVLIGSRRKGVSVSDPSLTLQIDVHGESSCATVPTKTSLLFTLNFVTGNEDIDTRGIEESTTLMDTDTDDDLKGAFAAGLASVTVTVTVYSVLTGTIVDIETIVNDI